MTTATNDSNLIQLPSTDGVYNGFGIFERENQAPPLEASEDHIVLFELPLPNDNSSYPIPAIDEDKWDGNHVKLPSNSMSQYPEIAEDGKTINKQRWELIRSSLLLTEIKNSRDLEKAIKLYNTKNADKWTFNLFHDLFDGDFEIYSKDFFSDLMPKIIDLALRLPELIKSPIPLLKQKVNKAISMSQEQAACLLANAFLCTFPNRNVGRKSTDYPEINFNRLFCSQGGLEGNQVTEKLKCLLSYFKRICSKMPTGVLTFQRRYINQSDFPDWSESTIKFSSIEFAMSSKKTIEDGAGMLQVDFANRYLGGGVLGWGCVQEEIRFVINPELLVGMLFCESMKPEEAILMTGCEQFSKYSGYSKTFTWGGNFYDQTPKDSFRRNKTYIVAIDATMFHKPHQQFIDFMLKRETNKAFVGFYHEPTNEALPIPVCSGNWGCGAFRGFTGLKALLQLIACCANRRNLFYCTFGNKDLLDEVYTMFHFLKSNDITIGEVWKYLKAFRENSLTDQPQKLYSFIYKEHARQKKPINLLTSCCKSSCEDMTDANVSNGSEEYKTTDENSVTNKRNNATVDDVAEIVNPPSKKIRTEDEEQTTDEGREVLENSVNLLNENLREALDLEGQNEPIHLSQDPSTAKSNEILTKNEEASSGLKKITDYFKRKT